MEGNKERGPRWDDQPLVPVEQRGKADAYFGSYLFGGVIGVIRARRKRKKVQRAQAAQQALNTPDAPKAS